MEKEWKKLCAESDLKKESGKIFLIEGKKIGVYFNGNEIFAFSPFCPHARANLTHGAFDRHTVKCHWHGWRFDLESGKGLNNGSQLETYRVSRQNGWIYVAFEKNREVEGPDDSDFLMPEIKWKNS